MGMNRDTSEWFLDDLMNRYNRDYPPIFKEGVEKYGTVLHMDNTVAELLDEEEREIDDAKAYNHAARIANQRQLELIERLQQEVRDLTDIIAELEE
jgi:hypothetical protein